MLLGFALIMGLLAMGQDSSLQIKVVDSSLHMHKHGKAKPVPGYCLLVADLHNDSDKQVAIKPGQLQVLRGDKGDKTLATCTFERAMVWRTTPTRRRFSTYTMTLAPREKVQVKFFFNWDPKAKRSPAADDSLRFRGSMEAAGQVAAFMTEPFKPEVLEGGP